MSTTTSDGIRIHYEIEGDGPPLILQHGFSQSLADWRVAGYVDRLKDHCRVILVDARGHGQSDKPHDRAAYSGERHAADIVAVLDALELPQADYWGYSMGGWIGFALAHHAPQRLRGLVLGGQHAHGRALRVQQPDGRDPELFFRSFFARIGLDFDKQPAEIRKGLLASDTQALAAAQQDRPSLEAALPAMTMPSLLYAGTKDDVFARAEKSAQAMPNCTFIALPGLDHSDAFYKATELVVPKVLSFLRTR